MPAEIDVTGENLMLELRFVFPALQYSLLLRFSTKGQCFEKRPVPQRCNDSPFWVVTVPLQIIRDHSDIFNSSFATMIIDLMEQYEVLDSPQATTVVRGQ
jgi:hydrogenase nickel incorporation protein HypA/HybF